jgi:hypothetical protein
MRCDTRDGFELVFDFCCQAYIQSYRQHLITAWSIFDATVAVKSCQANEGDSLRSREG